MNKQQIEILKTLLTEQLQELIKHGNERCGRQSSGPDRQSII
jgi:hypothetical protein